MRLRTVAALFLLLPLAAQAEIKSRQVDYQHDGANLRGYLVWDDAFTGKRPGVLVVHEWWGLNDYVRKRAEMLAQMGYVAFAADMYGSDKVTEHGKQAKEWMEQITANVEQWRGRAMKGLEVLRADENVDTTRMAAIGYCFGGATAMQLAYAGADLDGVASFHGSLPPAPVGVTAIKPAIFAAHGSMDGFVPPERVQKFQESLDAVGADWEMVVYGGARHAFTNPDAGKFGIDNLKYDEKADKRSWAHLKEFFGRIFVQ